MSKLKKFNLCYIIGLLLIIIAGSILIYLYRNSINICFWAALFFIYVFSYQPILNKVVYKDKWAIFSKKLEVLGDVLLDIVEWEEQEKEAQKSQDNPDQQKKENQV